MRNMVLFLPPGRLGAIWTSCCNSVPESIGYVSPNSQGIKPQGDVHRVGGASGKRQTSPTSQSRFPALLEQRHLPYFPPGADDFA